MTLIEFSEIYETSGICAASLVAAECQCELDIFVKIYPELSKLWRPPPSRVDWLGTYWAFAIVDNIQLYKLCPILELDGGDWACILTTHPNLYHECNWSLFYNDDWDSLLVYQPQFIKFKIEREYVPPTN